MTMLTNKTFKVAMILVLLAGFAYAGEESSEKAEKGTDAKASQSSTNISINSKLKIELYGKLKLDMAYDTARTNPGNFARWVESEAVGNDDNQLNITARETRLGLRFRGPDSDSIKVTGVVEVDFYEGGAENKSRLMMRHAYLQLDWKDFDMSLIAGQTWDAFSPLNAPTINYSVAWWVGNIGYRRPQLRITKRFTAAEGHKLTLTGAVARNIGRASGFDPGDSGEDSGTPVFEGRVGYAFPMAGKSAAMGFSGHWGREEYDTNSAGDNLEFDTWSMNFDILLPLADGVLVKGEVFRGQNLDAFLGGIGQGVNLATGEEISSTGGWVSLSLSPWDKWRFNLAGSMDDPDDEDLGDGARSLNSSFWGNFAYDLTESVWIGVEVGYWKTEYKNLADGDSLRTQMALVYTF